MTKAADDELSWLKKEVTNYRRAGQPGMAHALERLLSDNPDAVKVCQWLDTHQPVDSDDPPSDSSLDAMLKALAMIFSMSENLTPWELLPAKERGAYCDQVTRLAGELAELLQKDPHPDNTILELDIQKQKGAQIIRSDRMPALLRSLAAYMQTVKESENRDSRPNTPSREDANARTFARELASYFDEYYGRVPYEVIASCVVLRFPELKSPPDRDAIKNWLR